MLWNAQFKHGAHGDASASRRFCWACAPWGSCGLTERGSGSGPRSCMGGRDRTRRNVSTRGQLRRFVSLKSRHSGTSIAGSTLPRRGGTGTDVWTWCRRHRAPFHCPLPVSKHLLRNHLRPSSAASAALGATSCRVLPWQAHPKREAHCDASASVRSVSACAGWGCGALTGRGATSGFRPGTTRPFRTRAFTTSRPSRLRRDSSFTSRRCPRSVRSISGSTPARPRCCSLRLVAWHAHLKREVL